MVTLRTMDNGQCTKHNDVNVCKRVFSEYVKACESEEKRKEEKKTEQNRTEQNRTEQNRREQNTENRVETRRVEGTKT